MRHVQTRRRSSVRPHRCLSAVTPAATGAIIGGILGGKKGAVIGAVVGGGAGTAIVLTTEGKDISLPSGTEVTMSLKAPVDIRVPLTKG